MTGAEKFFIMHGRDRNDDRGFSNDAIDLLQWEQLTATIGTYVDRQYLHIIPDFIATNSVN